jgi:hypothetical protein
MDEVAANLRKVLDEVNAGELVCHPATRHRLEGAVIALEQLAGVEVPAPRSPNDRL